MNYNSDSHQQQLTDNLESALLDMDKGLARRCFDQSGLPPHEYAERVVAPALERIGSDWERGEIALSQVYMSGRICEDLVRSILPPDAPPLREHPPMAVAVLDDFHPLGKRILYSVLRANGFNPKDYGPTSVEDLILKVHEDGIRILVISTLMLASALKVKEVRQGLDRLGLDVLIIAGGAPFRFDPNLYREVGADATSPSASGAATMLAELAAGVSWAR